MPGSSGYRFGPFEIDLRRRLLLRDGFPVAMTTKALETLVALVERAGETVDKNALMRRLWPDTAVEEGNLTQQISTVRKALGEAPDDHQFIVTVARRGYRFVAPVTAVATASPSKGALTVGRDRELADLEETLDVVASGSGLLVSVSGEAGIGKSTLVSQFLSRAASECFILHGRCSERLAPGEPYLPVLEALEALLRNASRPLIAERLAARAPAWYLQVAPLIGDTAVASIAQPAGATQERQKRELAAFLLDLAQVRPVILFLDDVHWADVSTLDLVVYLTSRLDDTACSS